jgi:hypothetical protein
MRSVLLMRLCKLLATTSMLAWAAFLYSLWMCGVNPAGILFALKASACISLSTVIASTIWLIDERNHHGR